MPTNPGEIKEVQTQKEISKLQKQIKRFTKKLTLKSADNVQADTSNSNSNFSNEQNLKSSLETSDQKGDQREQQQKSIKPVKELAENPEERIKRIRKMLEAKYFYSDVLTDKGNMVKIEIRTGDFINKDEEEKIFRKDGYNVEINSNIHEMFEQFLGWNGFWQHTALQASDKHTIKITGSPRSRSNTLCYTLQGNGCIRNKQDIETLLKENFS